LRPWTDPGGVIEMRTAYRVLAFVIAAEVAIQAAAIAYAYFGLGVWIDGGGILDKATVENESATFTGDGGFALHGINGQMVIPVLVIVFFVLSFFAKVPRGVMWAGVTFGLVVLQVLLGLFGHVVPLLGALHGINALLIFGVAVMAAMAARGTTTDQRTVESSAAG
jgi:Family of unknown function (DUF6220)